MEAIFKADFSDVRIHGGPQAASIGAFAFTQGSNLFFAPGQYNTTHSHGMRLLGHELAHVLQQRTGRVRNPFGSGIAIVHDPGLEAEAERLAIRTASAPPIPPPGAQGAAPARGGPGTPIQPMLSKAVRPVQSLAKSAPIPLLGHFQSRKISYYVPTDDPWKEQAMEEMARKIAKESNTTFVHPDRAWKELKNKELFFEPIYLVAEQSDLNKKAKVLDGKVVPGIQTFLEEIKKKGLDVAHVPSITVISCQSAHAIAGLSEVLGGKEVTGIRGTIKIHPDEIEYQIGEVIDSKTYVPYSPDEQRRRIETVRDGQKIQTPDNHLAMTLLKK